MSHLTRRPARAAVACAAWAVATGLAGSSELTPRRAASGAVVTDGTVGPARSLSGPGFRGTADLGRQVASNLFHSFSRLDMARGESATFSGPDSVRNVLARVTGGRGST